jgi:hypothetical protein
MVKIINQDEAGYQQALKDAFADHLTLYTAKKNASVATGWVSMPLLAAASLAYDSCGFKLPVSSIYLPEWLVYKQF